MKPLLLALLAVASYAQQTLSFAPQGVAALQTLTGKRVKGVQVVSVIACGTGTLTGGVIYTEADKAGFSILDPQVSVALVNSTVSRNWRQYLLLAIREGSQIAIPLGAGKIITMSSQALVGLSLAHGIADDITPFIQGRLPNATPLLSALVDPAKSFDLSKGCQSGLLLSVYGKGYRSTSTTISLGAPVIVTPWTRQ